MPQVNPAAVVKDISVDMNAAVPVVSPAGVIQELSVSPDAVTPTVNPGGVINSLSIDPSVPPLTVDMTGNVNELRKSFAEPIPLEAIADLKLNLPDADLLDPIDLSGLRFSNVPNIPLRFTPDTPQEGADETPDDDEGDAQEGFVDTTTDDGGGGGDNTGTTTAAIVANEGDGIRCSGLVIPPSKRVSRQRDRLASPCTRSESVARGNRLL